MKIGEFEFKGFNIKVIGIIEKNKPYIIVLSDLMEVVLPTDILV
jgi:hypothetical protein